MKFKSYFILFFIVIFASCNKSNNVSINNHETISEVTALGKKELECIKIILGKTEPFFNLDEKLTSPDFTLFAYYAGTSEKVEAEDIIYTASEPVRTNVTLVYKNKNASLNVYFYKELEDYKIFYLEKSVCILEYIGSSKDIIIPDTIAGKAVGSLEESAFEKKGWKV